MVKVNLFSKRADTLSKALLKMASFKVKVSDHIAAVKLSKGSGKIIS